jgi:hypothetical protein
VDPYSILGVRKDCTRAEVKVAFRAKLQFVHPDRGGDDAAFIQIRSAYEQILIELDRRPPPMADAYRPAQAPHKNSAAKPPDPVIDSTAYAMWLHRIRGHAAPRTRQTGAPLVGMLAATFLPSILILYLLQVNFNRPDYIAAFGFMAFVVIGAWIRDQLSH